MKNNLLDRLILLGGPPRSGSTYLAESANSHPQIMTVIDDHRFECWTLYYYKTRLGLVTDIREGHEEADNIRTKLQARMFDEKKQSLMGVAHSDKTASFPTSALPIRPDGEAPNRMDEKLLRHDVPLDLLQDNIQLCMKSPEISFILPQLARALPSARFIIVYRPIIEIAESMFRKGHTVKLPIYHKRWDLERDAAGKLIPPPGVPTYWHDRWSDESTPVFLRCLIYAASYMLALEEGIQAILAEDTQRILVYDHSHLRARAGQVFQSIAGFLSVDAAGFAQAQQDLRERPPQISDELLEQYKKFEAELDLAGISARIEAFDNIK